MKKEKKIKFILAITYVVIISLFLWVFFENYSLNEITSYDFIKNNTDQLIKFKNSNFFLISIVFFIFSILWVLLLGFATPVCLVGGFIFGKWFGIILVSLGLTIGSTFLYIFANYFFKELVEKKFSSRFISLNKKFKKNEFLFFLVYRFVGGIPFFISNILPTLFNINKLNFFFGTLFGMMPQLFIWVSLGKGFEKIIDQNLNSPSLFQMLFFPDIYIPIIGFIFLLILGISIRNLFFKT